MKTPKSVEALQLALHGLSAPFFCEGSHEPDSPVTLVFKDQTRIEVKRAKSHQEQPAALQPLVARCEPAPFGAGNKTRYDRSVRDALQLKAAGGSFTVENFDPESAGILRQIRRQLLPHDPNPVSAELYCVNVYSQGGHFAPHKDTPRGEDMFGTLAYPCSHLYHQDSRFQQTSVDITPLSATMLKGRDQLAAATAIQSGVKVEFHPYLFEDCVDETWQLNRFPTPAERKKLRKQMSSALLEKSLPIRESFESVKKLKVAWLDPPPSSETAWWYRDYLAPEPEETGGRSELPAAAHLHSCEYCAWGYFGNEASYVGFYTYAALHFEIPPFGEGIRRPPQIELYPVSEQDQPAPKRAVKKSVGKKAATAKQAPKTKKPSRRKSAD